MTSLLVVKHGNNTCDYRRLLPPRFTQSARESMLTISQFYGPPWKSALITSLGHAFCERRSRNSIARRPSCRVVVHPFSFARTSPMRKFKMPIAKTNVRRAVHDECQDRCEARYREPGITCRPSDRVLNPFA